jgi:choline dehydrogenase
MMEGRGGAALTDLIIRNGRRSSIFRCYVAPRLGQRNLTVLTHALVSRLLFDGSTVIGVEVIERGQLRRYMAGLEVVLSLGAINTPKLLMQSGIGPEEELRQHDIRIVQNLPGSVKIIRITSRSDASSNSANGSPSAMADRRRRYTGRATTI